MARRSVNLTKLEIIRVATRMFLEKGYSNTSVKAISDELDISTGHLTFYFPTKEHMLANLVEMLCGFQWSEMRREVEEGHTSLLAVCLELMAMASGSEENEILKDFYLASYSHEMTLDIIRKNDIERAKLVFAEYCSDWSDEQYAEAETLVSGIEYATLMTTENSASLEMRISGALNSIMAVYNVPEEIRKQKIKKILAMDHKKIGSRMLDAFIAYVDEVNEQVFEEQFNRKNFA